MRSRYLTHAALIAALYGAVSYLQNMLLPGSGSFLLQFRVAEAISVLAFFTPAAIPGLTVGCLLFNLSLAGALPLDPVVGPVATLLATGLMWLTKKITLKGYPLPGLLLAALINGLLIGWELSLYIGGGFWLNSFYVFVSEGAVLMTLGTALYYLLKDRRLGQLFT